MHFNEWTILTTSMCFLANSLFTIGDRHAITATWYHVKLLITTVAFLSQNAFYLTLTFAEIIRNIVLQSHMDSF